nr:immunoglobulin light chain junction region [Macaca mulatta]MOX97839.1 immunoglobulin light chain junction region [Macaca mulatta]MOX98199.1 immunoglobulin light chain junction region [Macaca mulatta]MOX99317.1 immunoglobulin light chain junction region [Macaca mulatta]MOX99434.1 immunoglobulin light chain junction region [Macaca mulatta]
CMQALDFPPFTF